MRIRIMYICLAALAVCSAASASPTFDSTRAYGFMKKQCDFGPRPPGTTAHTATREYLAQELKRCTPSIEFQNFTYTQAGRKYPMTNIIGKFGNTEKPGVLLCAHWDTRPTADMDSDPVKRNQPIIGANDGASGVAVLLELAHMFRKSPPAVPVTIVFFDGEDFGPKSGDMFLGARYYASRIGSNPKFKYGILLDMVADSSLNIPREANSQKRAEFVVDKVWKAAADLGYSNNFTNSVKYSISDDHLPLLQAGISCIDVIDFDYPYWHTLADTPDKCSPSSLKIVGETVARVVYSEQL